VSCLTDVVYGIRLLLLRTLHGVQNADVRFITGKRKLNHIAPVLCCVVCILTSGPPTNCFQNHQAGLQVSAWFDPVLLDIILSICVHTLRPSTATVWHNGRPPCFKNTGRLLAAEVSQSSVQSNGTVYLLSQSPTLNLSVASFAMRLSTIPTNEENLLD